MQRHHGERFRPRCLPWTGCSLGELANGESSLDPCLIHGQDEDVDMNVYEILQCISGVMKFNRSEATNPDRPPRGGEPWGFSAMQFAGKLHV